MKKLLSIGALLITCLSTTGCSTPASGYNMQLFDTTYSFERAIVNLQNGEILEGKVDSWTDFEDGDQIQVKINGKTYLTHASNVILISE